MRPWTPQALTACLALIVGCSSPAQERESGAFSQVIRQLEDGLSLAVLGGGILEVSRPDPLAPYIVDIRATNFAVETFVFNRTCEPRSITFRVQYLGCPRDVTLTRRAFLSTGAYEGTLPGRAVGFEPDPIAPTWTPLEGTLSLIEGAQAACDPSSIETLTWTTTLSRGGLHIDSALGTIEQVPEAGAGACAGPFWDDADDVGQASLVVRHAAARKEDAGGPVRFALWANDRGDAALRQRFIDAVTADSPAPDFIIINGDFTTNGATAEIEQIAAFDATGLPWFATVGDRDIGEGETTALLESLGALTFRVDVGPLQVIVVDSADATVGSGAYDAMNEVFAEATQPEIRLVVTHVPPMDPSGLRGYGFKNRMEAARMVSLLHRNRTDALVVSHLKGFEEGHVGPLRVVRAGSAGGAFEVDPDGPHWVMVTAGCESDGGGEAEPASCAPADGSSPGKPVVRFERRDL